MKESFISCMGWIVCNEDGDETQFSKPFRRRQSIATNSSSASTNYQKQLIEFYMLLEQFQPDFVYENVFKWFHHDEILNSLNYVCRYFREISCCFLPVHIKYDSHLDTSFYMNNQKKQLRNREIGASLMTCETSAMESYSQNNNPKHSTTYNTSKSSSNPVNNSKISLPFKKIVIFSIIGNPTFFQIPWIENWKNLETLNLNVHHFGNVREVSLILDYIFEQVDVQQQFKRLKNFRIENSFNLNDNNCLNLSNILGMMKLNKVFKISTISCIIPLWMNDLLKHFEIENLKIGPVFDIDWSLMEKSIHLDRFKCLINSKNVQQFEKVINHDKFHVHQLEIRGSTCLSFHLKAVLDIIDRKPLKRVIFHQSVDPSRLFRLFNSQYTLQNSEITIKELLCVRFHDFSSCRFTSRIFSICVSLENENELYQLIEILKRLPRMAILCLVCENEQIYSSSKNEFLNDNKLSLSTVLFYKKTNRSDLDNVIGAPKFNFDRFHKISKLKNESQFLKEHCSLLDLKFKKSKPYFPFLKIIPL